MKPHKHANFIKEWADGAEIEFRTEKTEGWHPVFKGWSWDNVIVAEYRIKPQPKPDVVTSVRVIGKGSSIVWNSETHKVLNANLKLIFDGKTGKLKSAEVIE